MSFVMIVLGIIVVVAVMVDMVVTVLAVSAGHGFVSNVLSRSLWLTLRKFHRKRPELSVLSAAGPVIVLAVTVGWGLSFLVGWVLVFWPDAALSPTDGGSVGWLDRFDHAGALILGGSPSTVESGGQPWSMVAGVGRFTGVALVSFGLAYALPVISSVVRLRTVARNLHVVAQDADELDHSIETETDSDAPWTSEHLLTLTAPLVQLTQDIKAFPIVPFFHATSRDSALAPNLLALETALTDREAQPTPPMHLRRPLLRAIDGLLEVIGLHFLPRHTELPDPETDRAAWRRRALEVWCEHDVWSDGDDPG